MKYVMYVIMGLLAATVVVLAFMAANKPPVVAAEGVVIEEEASAREREMLFGIESADEDNDPVFNPDNIIEEIEEEEDPDPDIIRMDVLMYTIDNVNVREGPSVDYERVGYIHGGTVVHVTGQSRETGWYRIDYGDGTGFLSNNYVEDRDSAPTPTPDIPEVPGEDEILPEPDF
jgi:uncharacterized protein YgiM (DUF1202 family)